MPTPSEPERFAELARAAGRDRDRSRAAVAILRADARIGRAIDRALGEVGLTLPQFNVLMELAAAPEAALPLYALNDRLVTTAPNMSWLSTKMAQAGLVTKEREATDARVVVLALTEAAWEVLERALPLISAVEARLLEAFAPEELHTLTGLLDRLIDAERHPPA